MTGCARLSLWAVALSTLLLTACAAPGTRVVLLPQEGGRPSAVVVTTKGGEQTLNQPYQRATALASRVGSASAPVVDQADAARVRAENSTLFELAPPRAQRYTLYYVTADTALSAESQRTLGEALAAALARSGGDIVITGHTDTVDTGPRNDELSRRRAQQVRQLFIDQQFPAARIEAVGRGERELAVQTPDETDEPRNRRVIIDVR